MPIAAACGRHASSHALVRCWRWFSDARVDPAPSDLWSHVHRSIALTCGLAATVTTVGSAAGGATPPDIAVGVEAWIEARAWIDALRVPERDADSLALPGVAAAGVVLRLDGNVVARGQEQAFDALAERANGVLRAAVGRALADFATHASASWPEELRAALGPRLTLELDLAGAPIPLAGSTYPAMAAQIEPGAEAIAIRRGERWWVALPGRLLAANLAGDASRTLRSLAQEADLPPLEPRELAGLDSVAFYRVPTLRLVQPAPGATPVEAIRGEPAVPLAAIDAGTVGMLADALLTHLEASRFDEASEASGAAPDQGTTPNPGWSKALGLRGDYDPLADRHRPMVAGPLEQSLAILALVRLANVDRDLRPRALALAGSLLDALAEVDAVEEPIESAPEALAVVAMAAALDPEAVQGPAARALADRARTTVLEFIADPRRPEAVSESFATAAAGRQAIVAAAAAAIAASESGPDAAAMLTRARSLVQSAWTASEGSSRVGLLPWLAIANQLAGGGIPPEEARGFRQSLLARQIAAETEQGEPIPLDLLGGFDLTAAARPEADARSIVPATGLAIFLADPDITVLDGSEHSRRDLRAAATAARRSVRFLRQLTYLPPTPAVDQAAMRAAGGVRAAPWDLRMRILDQVMAIWLLAESMGAGVP